MFLDSTFSSGAQPTPGDADDGPLRSDNNNSVDDVFDLTGTSAAAGVSEIPRLRAEHGTAGHREGLSASKATTMQAGFDEGYSLGAVVGLRAGAVLGILEALCAAAEAGGGGGGGGAAEQAEQAEQARMRTLCERSAGELATASVFGPEWWSADGVWRFHVRGDEEGDALTFTDVAGAHPLIAKWEAVVRDEVRRWGVDLGILDAGDAQRVGGDGPAGGGANALEW